MSFKTNIIGDAIGISGILDIDSASALREALLNYAPGHWGPSTDPSCSDPCSDPCTGVPSVDLSEVESCDTATLQILLASRFRFLKPSRAIVETACGIGLTIPDLTIPAEGAHAA